MKKDQGLIKIILLNKMIIIVNLKKLFKKQIMEMNLLIEVKIKKEGKIFGIQI